MSPDAEPVARSIEGAGLGGWVREAGRLAATVAGLNAIVWERDPETLEVRWVNDRITEVLGHPVDVWRSDPDLWRRCLHPADRDRAMAEIGRAVAEQDFDLDLGGVAAVRESLLAALDPGEPVVLNLTGSPRSSSGLGLLLEVTRQGADGPPVGVLLLDAGPVRRLLDLTGLAAVLGAES